MNRSSHIAGQQQTAYHTPVLLKESLQALNIRPEGVYVDCTFGGGGHSGAILQQLGPQGRLLAFDQDEDAVRNLPKDDRLIFVPHNFRHLQRFLKLHKFNQVDGILADLGVSSHQFNEPERGFSIRFNAELDMRMDKRKDLTAARILETYDEKKLHKLFERYGEVTNAKTLARCIVESRGSGRLRTVNGFREAVSEVVKGNPNRYFAQVFQALRMEVNDEMGALMELLEQIPACLKTGGRVAIITFHSLEDRVVKQFFKKGAWQESETSEQDIYGTKPSSPLRMVDKKPITPGQDELKANPRSRSAKLRTAEKI
jgi:16S rRNA (cytosine1402-N4)-methyltransferase